MPNRIAVLTGDLIASTQARPDQVDAALEEIRLAESALLPAGRAPSFTRSRGDGWQVALHRPALAFRLALLVLARLAARPDLPQSRIAIGLGPVDSLGSRDLSDAAGRAFTASGRALEALSAGRLVLAGQSSAAERGLATLIDLRSALWTAEQAQAAALALRPDPPTGRAMAAELGISPQAISARLSGADAQRLVRMLADLEAADG